MNHALSAVATLSISSLLLASGCASSQARQSSTHSLDNPTALTLTEPCPETSFHVELTIGSTYCDETIPDYRLPTSQMSLGEIQIELEAMFDLDADLVSNPETSNLPGSLANTTIRAIDHIQSDRLKEIVAHIGWPTRDQVGLKATQAAYMVIQHAGHDIDFQNQCLSMMIDLVEQGELPASYVALLTDRIRVFGNQPQVFGTQMTMVQNEFGVMVPTPTVPIEDPAHLDARRRLMGMPTHAQFVGAIALAYQASLNDPGTAFAEVQTGE